MEYEMTIPDELRQFILDNYLFGQAATPLSDETSFLENGIIDSTGLLELIAFLEVKYGIRLEDQEITPDNLDSIGRLTRFLRQKLAAPAAMAV
jgi:acyl carrier protein